MALVVKDRVKETTTTTGTGTITLAGAVDGFQSFSAALADGDTTYYAISETSTGEWEVGLGTFTATGTTLARTTVLASSNAGSAVSLTAEADVFITQPASKSVFFDGSGDLTLNQDPTSALHAATKEYVDTIAAAGLHYHDPVRVEQEGNLSATYDNGTAGVGATLTNNSTQAALSIDGVTLSLNDRVLIYEQTNAYENGVYTVTDTGSASTNWVLTRSTDTDSYAPSDPDSLGQGDAFFVLEGTAGAGELYVMNTEGAITFGTTNITFTQVAATAVFTAGDGLTLTGTTFAVGAGTGVTVNANDIAIGQAVGTSDSPTFAGMTTTADITFGTNDKASFGTTLDIYSDGTNSYVVEGGTGNLYIDSADLSIRNAAGTATMASFDDTGSVTLNHNNSTKFTTQSYGIDVTGNVQADGLIVDGDATFDTNTLFVNSATNRVGIGNTSPSTTLDVSGTINTSGNITVSGTVDGRDVATDGAKLDNIEANADVTDTANVTAAGALMDSEVTNLAQVKAFDSSDYATAAQGTTADAALPKAGGTMTGTITFAPSQTFDGRDVSADGAKLDGIETGATADQTKADIDALGINAATLDSLDSTQFLRSDANDTATGSITFSNASGITIGEADIFHQTNSTWRGITVKNNGDTNEVAIDGQSSDGTQRLSIYGETSSQGFLNPTNNSWKLRLPTSGSFTRDNIYTIWDSGNDGSGSGLDADTVDGIQASSFLRSDTSDSMSGALTITGNGSYVGNWGYSTLVLQDSVGYPGIDFRYGSNDWLQRMESGGSMQWAYRSGGNYTERMELTTAGVLTLNGNTVWNAGNDGNLLNKNTTSYYNATTWIDFGNSGGTGLYWSGGTGSGLHWYPYNSSYFRLRSGDSGNSGIRFNTNGTDRNWIYQDNSNQIGFLSTSGSWILRTTDSGQVHATSFHGDGSNLTNLPSGTSSSKYVVDGYALTGGTGGASSGWDADGDGNTTPSDALAYIQRADDVPLSSSASNAKGVFCDLSGTTIGGLQWVENSFLHAVVNYKGWSSRWITRNPTTTTNYGALTLDSVTGLCFYAVDPSSTIVGYSGDVVFNVKGDGAFCSSFNAVSDIRIKENIELIDDPIVKLQALNGYSYDLKTNGKKSYGVIAQEVEEVLPHAVTESEDVKAVDYNAIVALLVETVKKQEERIAELEKKVSA